MFFFLLMKEFFFEERRIKPTLLHSLVGSNRLFGQTCVNRAVLFGNKEGRMVGLSLSSGAKWPTLQHAACEDRRADENILDSFCLTVCCMFVVLFGFPLAIHIPVILR